jgi:hypothetical protein
MAADPAAVSLVRRFVAELNEIPLQMAAVPGLTGIAELVRAVTARQVPRTGQLPDGSEYEVHGIGCALVTPSGLEIDVDVEEDGSPSFNPWRVRQFALSADPASDLELPALASACQELAGVGELRALRPDWYAPVD